MRVRTRPAAGALLLYTAISFLYYGVRVVPHPARDVVGFGRDPQIFVWAIAWWPHAIVHGQNPFVTHAIWSPDGVNLVWAVSIPGVAIALWPVTALWGAVVAYDVAAVAAPALAAWTAFLLCRHVTRAFAPSLLGGYLFGFSGYMVGQELGHLHMTNVFAVPLVALAVLRFVERELDARGLAWRLGVLIAVQLTLSTELVATITLALLVGGALAFVIVRDARPRLRALVRPVALAYVFAALLATPFTIFALRGFETTSINRPKDFDADLLNFVVPTRLIAAGAVWAPSIAERFPGNDAERGAYIGLPLVVLVVLFAYRDRRRSGTRFLVAAAGVSAFCALGTSLVVAGHRVVPLPWAALAHLPALNNVLPVRLSLFTSLAVAVAAALWTARSRTAGALLLPALAILALVPRLDIPVWSTTPTRPAFFADDLYRSCLAPNDNVFTVPFGGAGDSMLWQAESGFAFRLAGGYIRPTPPDSWRKYPAVWLIHFDDVVPPEADLRTLFAAKHVTRVVVEDAENAEWQPVLGHVGGGTHVGGVFVYPSCA